MVRKQEAADRRELVRPAPDGFIPSRKAEDLEVTLIPYKRRMKKGESFWYKLEIQNLSQQPFWWWERNSFIKFGNYLGDANIHILVTVPDGKEREGAAIPFHIGDCGRPSAKAVAQASGVSEEDFKDLLLKATAEDELARGLRLTLFPGEMLVTRPWRFVDRCLASGRTITDARALRGGFREWPWDPEFRASGTYKIRFAIDEPRKMGSRNEPPGTQRVRFYSNAITVEVEP